MATTSSVEKGKRVENRKHAVEKRKRAYRRLLARRQLSVRRSDLSVRQSAAARASQGGAHQAAAARALGHDAGPQFHLRAPQSADQEARSRHDLRHRPRTWRAGDGRQHLSRRHLQRSLSGHLAGRGGHEAAVHPVLFSRRNSEPRRAGDARLDPRRRRTWLLAVACLRRRFRQSRSHRRRRRRRWRSGDGTACDELAFQQVPRIRCATARCCRSCISTATRSPIRPCWRASRTRSSSRFFAATATRLISSKATTRRSCTSSWPRTLETVIGEIRNIQADARKNGFSKRPIWPMIVMRTPKGWTGPKEIDGKREEGYWRSHRCR